MTSIETILFPTDLSPNADAVFAHAGFLAESLGARLVLFHVAGIPVSEYAAWGAGKEAEVWQRVELAAQAELTRRAQTVKARCDVLVRHDTPAARVLVDLSVLDQIHRTRPGLVMMPMQSRSGFSRFFVGSVTEEVVRHARAPVLAMRDAAATQTPAPYRRILVATDLSGASRMVFGVAAALAAPFAARITALHVAPRPSGPGADAVRAFLRPELEVSSARIEEGPAWSAIIRVAEEEEADLVAIARRGADSLGEDLFGSTTERVLRHAPCPVLVA